MATLGSQVGDPGPTLGHHPVPLAAGRILGGLTPDPPGPLGVPRANARRLPWLWDPPQVQPGHPSASTVSSTAAAARLAQREAGPEECGPGGGVATGRRDHTWAWLGPCWVWAGRDR